MLYFNELCYSQDSKEILIDVSVYPQNYYKDITISKIIIDNQDTYSVSGPSSNPKYTYTDTKNAKNVSLAIPVASCGIVPCKDLLFVYAIAEGTPSPDVPCGFDSTQTMSTLVDLHCIYDSMLTHVREIERDCDIPKNFIDILLRYKAFELYIKTGNYPMAIKYWKKYLSEDKINNIITTKPCGCHG